METFQRRQLPNIIHLCTLTWVGGDRDSSRLVFAIGPSSARMNENGRVSCDKLLKNVPPVVRWRVFTRMTIISLVSTARAARYGRNMFHLSSNSQFRCQRRLQNSNYLVSATASHPVGFISEVSSPQSIRPNRVESTRSRSGKARRMKIITGTRE